MWVCAWKRVREWKKVPLPCAAAESSQWDKVHLMIKMNATAGAVSTKLRYCFLTLTFLLPVGRFVFFFFFGKLPICCLNHTVTAVHCLCCCFSSWPVITRYLWFNDVATEQSNQSILSKHSPGSNFMWLFLEQGVWQLMMLVNIYNLYRGSKKLFSPPDC